MALFGIFSAIFSVCTLMDLVSGWPTGLPNIVEDLNEAFRSAIGRHVVERRATLVIIIEQSIGSNVPDQPRVALAVPGEVIPAM